MLPTPVYTPERLVTRAEIARLAGVRRPTVTTWAKRHSDFPKPVRSSGEDYFSLTSITSWLDRRLIPAKELAVGEEPGLTYGQRIRGNWPASDHVPDDPPVAQADDTAHVVDQLLGTVVASAARTGGGSVADYLMFVICLVFLRNCAEAEWRSIREAALHPGGTDPDVLIRLIGELADRALRAHGIVPGVQPVLERVRPRTVTDLSTVILQCDELGPGAIDPLLTRFGAEARLAEGSYLTPPHVARLMATIAINPGASSYSMYDPYMRGGELGTAVRDLLQTASLTVRGESPDPGMLWLAGMNLMLRGIPALLGTEYTGPLPGTGTGNERFDAVLTNPPFNSPHLPTGDEDARWIFGSPPPHNANYAWPQIAISALGPEGTAAVLMPLQATVTSDKREHLIRSQMVERGAVTAIISLPPRLFAAANVAATVWVLRSPTSGPQSVLFVDARRMTLQDAGQTIRKAYDQKTLLADSRIEELDGGGTAARVSIATVRQRNYSLNPADYMGTSIALAPGPALEATGRLRNLENLRARLTELDARVGTLQLFERVGFDGDLPEGWKRLPLSDVCSAVQAGPSYSRFQADEGSKDAPVPVIASRHLQGGRVVAADPRNVSENLAQRLAKFRLAVNDILCVRSGTPTAPAIVETGQDGWLFDTNLIRLRVKPDTADPRFLLGFLSLPAVLDWMRDRSTGSAIAFITAGSLRQLEVPLPPLAEQRAIASSLLTFDELIAAHEDFARAASDVQTAISAHLIQGGLALR